MRKASLEGHNTQLCRERIMYRSVKESRDTRHEQRSLLFWAEGVVVGVVVFVVVAYVFGLLTSV